MDTVTPREMARRNGAKDCPRDCIASLLVALIFHRQVHKRAWTLSLDISAARSYIVNVQYYMTTVWPVSASLHPHLQVYKAHPKSPSLQVPSLSHSLQSRETQLPVGTRFLEDLSDHHFPSFESVSESVSDSGSAFEFGSHCDPPVWLRWMVGLAGSTCREMGTRT
jgi:hypothetical protein